MNTSVKDPPYKLQQPYVYGRRPNPRYLDYATLESALLAVKENGIMKMSNDPNGNTWAFPSYAVSPTPKGKFQVQADRVAVLERNVNEKLDAEDADFRVKLYGSDRDTNVAFKYVDVYKVRKRKGLLNV